MGGAGAEASGVAVEAANQRRFSINALLDGFFFIYAGIAAAWLAWLVFTESFGLGWWGIAFFVVFWLVLAYLVLPRLHRILTTIYVPDYFIGRARTATGCSATPSTSRSTARRSRCTPRSRLPGGRAPMT